MSNVTKPILLDETGKRIANALELLANYPEHGYVDEATLVNNVTINNLNASYGLKRDSVSEGVATYTPSSSPDTNPAIVDQCALGSGNRIVSFKYKLTKNDPSFGEPQNIRLILGASETHYYPVEYDEWVYVQEFTSVDLTRVYFNVNGYTTAPTSGKITLQVKDYYVYNVDNLTGDLVLKVINSQRYDFREGKVSYRVVVPQDRDKINVRDFGVSGNGIDDDTISINNVFHAFRGKWEKIYFPAGTYIISSTVEILEKTTVFGDGNDTIITATDPNYLKSIPIRLGPIRPYILVRSQDVTIDSICLVGSSECVASFVWGIAIYNTEKCSVKNVYVSDINCDISESVNSKEGYGIAAAYSSFVTIEKCNVQKCGYECIGFYDFCSHGIVRDCYTQDGKRTCIQVHRGCSHILVSNNYMKQTHDKHDACLTVHGNNEQDEEITDLRMENNTIVIEQNGSQVYDYCAPAQIMSYTIGCWFANNNISGGKRALYVGGSIENAVIVGNQMECNQTSDYGVTSGSDYVIIVGNRMDNKAESGNEIYNHPVVLGNVGISV